LSYKCPNKSRMMFRIILQAYIMDVSFSKNQMAWISSFLHPILKKISQSVNSKKD